MSDLSIIQKTYDVILWYAPILERLPKHQRFTLGDRIITRLYDFLEELVTLRYAKEKIARLEQLNNSLDVLRYQTKLLLDFQLMSPQRYEYATKQLNSVGRELGSWLKQQRQKQM